MTFTPLLTSSSSKNRPPHDNMNSCDTCTRLPFPHSRFNKILIPLSRLPLHYYLLIHRSLASSLLSSRARHLPLFYHNLSLSSSDFIHHLPSRRKTVSGMGGGSMRVRESESESSDESENLFRTPLSSLFH
ncbi:hypothetical protein M413DRAFT_376115 [Hebeloma cylindrosporum]|uniref:Uncharacterized protein n=1 Tax=Hebeloma cylindrosporum TaxID=76867 RepID=A0A0C3CK86_HEBCY|nr:hypothetical protein M413DRAFT_376115 [Hebeloma cylindrosporum h7]